jgi:hypothetical protein
MARHTEGAAKLEDRLQQVVDEITHFETRCNEQNYTDSGEVWELLYELRRELLKLLKGL